MISFLPFTRYIYLNNIEILQSLHRILNGVVIFIGSVYQVSVMLKHQLKMKRIHQCQQVIHSIKTMYRIKKRLVITQLPMLKVIT
ncbi:amidase [Staphylococcus aureus]|uniref:Amidase n=3 Tax=Staphylococcus aureus TaxID=1280 RepID=A0A7Z1N0G1_STAAU|nr:amidase [Staphylococcus aureus]EEV70826.1 phage amidase [Staphylococcus aureus A9635]EFB54892.1 phage amidase [Staphylococcus aureus subsp. aureus WBG10049]EFU26949.1 phage amidase [Staphylococcus aureus subsp. aureus CGS01]UER52341.1 amidase [Staphylococcus aureus subsp. aureus ST398]BAF68151.1 truncated phage amidase [Staphylococcus aureus subsp. aureus str. Newman]